MFYARAAKDFPLAHALFALATFVAVCGKVLAETPGTKLDFARQFDIGAGRKLFLECRGAAPAGYPTVVLIAGYHGSSDSWTQSDALSLLPLAVGPAVLPRLARENRVCAYDRPGTLRSMADSPLTDRSTPVAQPRAVPDLVSELHGLLSAAQVPTPYVLVGHSLGGLIALLYARTYSSDVRGIVFVDALSPTFPIQLGALWPLDPGGIGKPLMLALGALLASGVLTRGSSGQTAGAGQTASAGSQPPTDTNDAGGLLGGLGGLLNKLQQGGLGNQANSWVGSGQNQPVSPGQLGQALGPNIIKTLSQMTGVSEDELTKQLSQGIPVIVNTLTPNGRLPTVAELSKIME